MIIKLIDLEWASEDKNLPSEIVFDLDKIHASDVTEDNSCDIADLVADEYNAPLLSFNYTTL